MKEVIAKMREALKTMQEALDELEKQAAAAPAAVEAPPKLTREELQQRLAQVQSAQELFDVYMPQIMAQASERAAEVLAGIEGILQFNLTGEGGGNWHIVIKEGKPEVKKGEHESPTTTFTIEASDWVALMQRKVDPQALFMSGKLRIAGDMSLAMKLGQLTRAT